jgi:DNA-binding transcriptional ArsR family regulator
MTDLEAPLAAPTEAELAQLRAHAAEAAALLKALSNENRLMILCALAGGERSVTELNEEIDLSQSALSQQLALLRGGGFVKTRREAQTIYYSLAPTNALHVIELVKKLYCASPARASSSGRGSPRKRR